MSPVEILVALMMAIGVVGIVLPVLPGLLIVLAAVLLWAFDEGTRGAWIVFAVAVAVYLLGLLLQFLIPGKRMRAAGVRTSTLLFGVLMAIGLLWVSAWALFDRYLLRENAGTAFISAGDVWFIAPFLVLGVVLLAVGTSTVTLWRYLRV